MRNKQGYSPNYDFIKKNDFGIKRKNASIIRMAEAYHSKKTARDYAPEPHNNV